MATATLLNVAVGAAQATAPAAQFSAGEGQLISASVQATFVYGSGGTNVTAYVQCSLDGGASFFDVACFQFTTASGKQVVNLSSLTPITTLYTPTDGALGANTAKDGLIGPIWRVKWGSTGTYAGSSLRIDVNLNGTSKFFPNGS